MLRLRIDASQLGRLGNRLGAAGTEVPKIMQRAVARAGDMARTQLVRDMTAATGLKRAVIVRSLKVTRPSWGTADYRIDVRGGFIALKFFRPREVKGGVSAYPAARLTRFPGAFRTSGLKPNRRLVARLGGHVFENMAGGAWRGKISKVTTTVRLPDELLASARRINLDALLRTNLDRRLDHEIGRVLDRL